MGWNDKLSGKLYEKWKAWLKVLPSIEEIKIPRLYSSKLSPGKAGSIDLHTFVDASADAYCAVCYLRVVDNDGVECVLVGAKTKVAPLKPLPTIPRKEFHIDRRYFWSDSRDVLCWLRSTTRQFVACRVGEILESSNEEEWRGVPGLLLLVITDKFQMEIKTFHGKNSVKLH